MTPAQAAVRQAAHENLLPELTGALQAIVDECDSPSSRPPYSADSYLPAHLLVRVRTALARAKEVA